MWGGIAGCQTLLRVMLTEGLRRGLSPAEVVRLCAEAPARRFRLEGKGSLEPGADADLVLVDLATDGPLSTDELLYRHPISPFVGRVLRGRVARTIVRGATVAESGRVAPGPTTGSLVRPAARG